MTARNEILEAARLLSGRLGSGAFTVQQVVDELRRRGSRYAESTIRAHVTSRMCVDAPDHHAKVYNDLVRVEPGRYQLRS